MAFNLRLGGGSSQPRTQPGRMPDLRMRHIQSLQSQCSVEVESPNVRYRVPFRIHGQPVVLKIFLPMNFPQVPPVLQVEGPPMQHPWIDSASGNVIGCHLLQEWSMTSDLGQVASHVVRQLTENPPHFTARQTSYPHSPHNSVSSGSGYNHSVRATNDSHLSTTASAHLPQALPSPDDLIGDLSIDEVREMASSQAKLSEFVERLSYTQRCHEAVEHMKESVARLAEQNLAMEPELNSQKRELKQLQEEIAQRSQSVQEQVSRQQSLAEQFNPETIVATLAAQTSEAESHAEDILQKFHDQDMEVGEFVKSYRKAKQLEHARRHKERLYRNSISI